MKTTNLTYLSQDGHSNIHGWLKEPDKVNSGKQLPRAVIQILHGAAEHSGRYEQLAKYLVDKGFVVCAHDHIGHGLSVATSADLGQMPAKEGTRILVEDTHSLRQLVQPRYLESVPYILLGHSMGSLIARLYLSEHGRGIDAAVLSGTTHPNMASALINFWLASLICRRQGERAFSATLQKNGLGSFAKKIKKRRTDFDWLCTDEKVVDAYIADPLCGFAFSNGAYVSLTRLLRDMVSNMTRAYTYKKCRLLLISGKRDPVSHNGGDLQSAMKFYRAAAVQVTDIKLYDDLRHEVFNEPIWRKVTNETVDWLVRQLGV